MIESLLLTTLLVGAGILAFIIIDSNKVRREEGWNVQIFYVLIVSKGNYYKRMKRVVIATGVDKNL